MWGAHFPLTFPRIWKSLVEAHQNVRMWPEASFFYHETKFPQEGNVKKGIRGLRTRPVICKELQILQRSQISRGEKDHKSYSISISKKKWLPFSIFKMWVSLVTSSMALNILRALLWIMVLDSPRACFPGHSPWMSNRPGYFFMRASLPEDTNP